MLWHVFLCTEHTAAVSAELALARNIKVGLIQAEYAVANERRQPCEHCAQEVHPYASHWGDLVLRARVIQLQPLGIPGLCEMSCVSTLLIGKRQCCCSTSSCFWPCA